jgi:putative ATP-binding cassette transporter
MTDESVVQAPATGFWRKLWRLAWPYFKSGEWKSAWGLLIAVIALALIGIYIDVQLNAWNRDFYNVLQTKDLSQKSVTVFGHDLLTLNHFFYQIGKFTILALLSILVAVYQIYLRQILQIRWRRWMTEQFTKRWLSDRMHYRLQLQDYGADNPEQRIEADVASFTGDTLRLSIGVLSNVVNLITFVGILWTISGPLSFVLGSMPITIPGYMVWAAILYAGAGTLITFWIGRPLVAANFDQERFGADFRFRMTRIRENSESIALYGGEAREGAGLEQTFGRIWNNWWRLIKVTKTLNWVTTFYAQLAIIFPILVAAPRYFAGAIDLGTVFQIVSAFRQVQGSLSWFIDAFQSLASWKATTNRLVTFSDALAHAEADARAQPLQVESGATTEVDLSAQDIFVPTGRTLMSDVQIKVPRGDKVLISGPSGSGKTTLFRALAGLWPFARGTLRIPKGSRVLFLSQKPYLPLGTLRDVVSFPSDHGTFTDEQIRAVLEDVKLPHLVDRLDEDQNWSMTLSVGEQQRVAIGRALLNKPDWLFMDEATSALDEDNERHVYELVSQRLAQSAIVSIAHRPSVAAYHRRRLAIVPELQQVQSVSLAPAE